MPNWCMNDVTFRHKDPKMLERVKTGYYGDGLFREFFPTPQELTVSVSPPATQEIATENFEKFGAKDWYDWNLQNWGTKWDVYNEIGSDFGSVDKPGECRIAFDTAWAPPVEFFAKMSEQLGFEIEAFYWEPGMDFCGKWTTEGGDESYEGDNIPQDIDEVFGISEAKASWGLDDEGEAV